MGNSLCRDCFGLGSAEGPNPSRDELRIQAAAAAEARLKSQETRGVKNTSEFRRLQERQARIDKAEEEAARKGNFDNQGGLKWQMS